MKKILNAVDAHQLFEKYDTDFKEKFILSDLKENYFYLQTGILTNEKSIQKYINLKDKLGNNFVWNDIKIAKEYFDFSEGEIKIRLSRFQKIESTIRLAASLLFFGAGFYLLIRYSSDLVYFSKNDYYKFFTLILIPFVFGYFLFYSVDAFLMARSMRKELESGNQ